MAKNFKLFEVVLFVLIIGLGMIGCDNGTNNGIDDEDVSSLSPFEGVWQWVPNWYVEYRGNTYTDHGGNTTCAFEWSGNSTNGTITFLWTDGPFTNTYIFISPDEVHFGNGAKHTRKSH